MTINNQPIDDSIYRAEDGDPLRGMELIEAVKKNVGDTVLLSFSQGKDSLATWLHIREHFNIIPFFMYWIPGAKFAEESLDYYEQYFGTHIYRLPHPLFWRKLREDVFQPPHHVGIIRAANLTPFSYADIEDMMAVHAGLEQYVTACGMRANDNLARRNLILQKGAVGIRARKYFYPIWDWDMKQTIGILKKHGVKVPYEYNVFGRTIASWEYQYLKPLSVHYPEAFERMKKFLPLIDLELFRYEVVGKRRKKTKKVLDES